MKLIKFYKDNCSPCAQLSKVLDTELSKYDVELIEMNALDNEDAVSAYGVTTLPMMFITDGTKVIASKRGVTFTAKFLAEHLKLKEE